MDQDQEFARARKPQIQETESEDEVIIYSNKISQSKNVIQNCKNRRCSRMKQFTKLCLTLLQSITVEPIMFLFMFSTYLYLALIELYFYQKFGLQALREEVANSSLSNFTPNHSFCVNSSLLDEVLGNGTNDKVEGDASLIILINSAVGQVTSVVVALVAGPLSDRYGRKPALLFALLGNTLAATINVLLVYFNVAVYYFIGSGLLMGVTGGFTIIMTVSLAYVADVSSKQSLTFRIGILQAMLYLSQALGDAVTGQWLVRSGCNFNPLLWLALASSVLGVVYLIFLKEPFTKEVRIAKLQENGNLSLFSMLTRGFKIFISPKYSKWRLWFTLAILSISIINGIGSFELLTLFQVHKPLEWGPGSIGWYGLANTVIQAFSLFCLLPVLVYLKVPDSLIVLVGLFVASGLNFFIGFLKTSWEMYLGEDPYCTCGCCDKKIKCVIHE